MLIVVMMGKWSDDSACWVVHNESWITGVCSPYVISLSDFAYYVFGQEPAVAVHLAL